ncbi:heme/hemin ABC transporter substrate-binding protein [Pseudomonas vancouverensis]|uniref:Hemin ABC transporter substrate-binding protein n=1 Tax=Pseudomonas vancouverensis TaxID=95300 RepID=A0A1H2NR92_PSEVA|nr:ABC transporter substrate-binding protein [Pseudomonas vancouverensis]KAB0491241.1 ABC transporter substrate-binding protein [Pseudomonas vancouverensis]TDB64274.1 hemin ABC transporter substrate-binding protein [Pseudomonas vancouverensis]SDV07641.1 iron complex transport system substrate-binding protein [Pseudomonas vancouverensis]
MRMKTLLACAGVLVTQMAVADALPQRWVSAGGAFSEWVVALGGESKLVGVDSTSQFPQSLHSLPGVGYQRALAAEGILALKPDILVGSDEMGPPPVLAQLKAAGVRIELLSAKPDVPALQHNLTELGQLLGKDAEAQALMGGYLKRLQSQADWVKAAQQQQPAPRVLMLLSHSGGNLQVAGKDTLAAWMIQQAGGKSLGEHNGYKPVSNEAMLSLDPQVIIFASSRSDGETASKTLLEQNPILAQTQAGRDGRIVVIDPTLLVGGLGPRIPDALTRLSTAFYPDVKAQTAEISQ